MHKWMKADTIGGIWIKLEEIGLEWLHMDNNERHRLTWNWMETEWIYMKINGLLQVVAFHD